ncbi:hypothetical protein POTOM_059801 [Populus tomentosa]|uniref:Uncharacterized protein n=1 Tax=Populus tomentosa TaxID=118781 RepID=A0A8X7XUR3_POPTO|nr:hypothetical protein POTOM_059801 [Populus tomentosa]
MLLILLSLMADKLLSDEGLEHPVQELTNPVPIDDNGSSAEAVLGKNPDVHYIYVCTKFIYRASWKLSMVSVKSEMLCILDRLQSETFFLPPQDESLKPEQKQ